jgi:PAS domain S-box-containing protein
MNHRIGQGLKGLVPGLLLALLLLASTTSVHAVNPPVHIGQYAHTSWTNRDGYSLGAVFSMAQTPDGYLWLAAESGLVRFDGLKFTVWQPPAGTRLPAKPYALLASRDGSLWIGTFAGLARWDGVKLTQIQQMGGGFVTSLLEDRDGAIWAGVISSKGELCEVRGDRAQCHRLDGAFGTFVWSLAEDRDGVLWATADTGLWRWKPGQPKQYEAPGRLGDLVTAADGQLLIGVRAGGLHQFVGDRIESYTIRSAAGSGERIPDQVVKSNKLLREREGNIWIGTDGLGLLRVENGKADAYSSATGLSGDIACSLFEDREGNIWFASEKGLDRFRRLSVPTLRIKKGPSSEITRSVLASTDGSIWVAASEGLTRWKDGRMEYFRGNKGLPDIGGQSLYQDSRGRIWVSTYSGLAYFERERFFTVEGQPGNDVSSIAGDEAGNLWFSGPVQLARFKDTRLVEGFPWRNFGLDFRAISVADRGGVWLGFWVDGGVMYFKDGKVREKYTAENGLGAGHVSGLRLDEAGVLWVATEKGGLSRIEDGRIRSLTTANGLPCNAIHWSVEDGRRALWMYTACGLVRITREDLEAWIADPGFRVDARRWGPADGVPVRGTSPAYSNPPVAKAADGKLWFVAGEGVQVVDPDHMPFNTIPPPVYIEQVIADRHPYAVADGLRLPPLVRDVTIEFTALSLIDSQSVQFRYRLEGHDREWQEAGDRRQVFYTNLKPGKFRFLVNAANNNGVWNEEGAQLEFSIAPAYYQTYWFRLACALLLLGLIWGGLQLRLRRLRLEEKRLRDVIEGIPTMAFSVHANGEPDLVNPRWLEYAGLPANTKDRRGWESAIHPDDVAAHLEKWRAALANGTPFENEARHRSAKGEYRWFLVRAVPLRDKQGRITKWYGTLTDVEERKRAEEERERLRRLETQLAHTNRLSMLGELTASLAHEVNQPIGAAIASAGAGLRWLDREQPALPQIREAFVRIKDDGQRAADIIAGLKAFYRKESSPQRVLLDVNEVVREMLVLLRQEADRHSVVMQTVLAPDLPAVRADRVQLQQVLMNLMVNGIEAMREAGGKLVIRTEPIEKGLRVSVSDTGVGIPADQLENIFSAFVTTKASGTGMGLAISRTIIESHEGRLWAEATPGPGATFRFTLPAAGGSAEAQQQSH